jgi:hypothetical protein
MSNVLIGIIGVILFIGLALAGALFLGPRFQESTNNSKASAAIQAVAQVAHAANMSEVNEGRPLNANETISANLVNKHYLKSMPANPTAAPGSGMPFFVDVNAVGNGSGKVAAVIMRLADADTAKAICEAARRQTGMLQAGQTWTPVGQSFTASNMTTATGCLWDGGSYYVFSRI